MRYVVRPDGAIGEHADDDYAVERAISGGPQHGGWRLATADEVERMVAEATQQLHANASSHVAFLQEVR